MTKTKPIFSKVEKLSIPPKSLLILGISCLFSYSSNHKWEGEWDATLQVPSDKILHAKILLNQEADAYQGRIVSYDLGKIWDYGIRPVK